MERKILHYGTRDYDLVHCFDYSEYSIDTETSSLRQDELEITGISICNDRQNLYIPIKDENRESILNDFCVYLGLKGQKVIMHNIVFDMRVFHKYGIYFDECKIFDTMIASHLINENDKHGLKHLTRTILGREVEEFNITLSHYCEEFYQYALDDSLNTWLLYKHFLPLIIQNNKLAKLFFKIEMPFQQVLLEMAIEGVLINTELLSEQQVILQEEIQRLEIQLLDELGVRYSKQLDFVNGMTIVSNVNFNSPKQLIEMFDKFNLEITERTPSGNPSVGKNTLKKHKKHPFVKLLQKYKDCVKLYNGFVSEDGQIVTNLQSDGRVRPNFMDCGTATGRMSCSAPNLQQLPNNRDDMPVKVREVFKAPDGYKMFSCDYSGQEVFTMAHISRDPNLIKMLTLGQDQHMTNANAVFNLGLSDEQLIKGTPEYESIEEKYYGYRKKGKIFSFGVPYGMGAHKFSNDFSVSEDEAQGMIDNLAKKFPRLFECIEETHRLVDKDFQVQSLAGRIRHFGEDYSLVKLKNKDLSKYDDKIIILMKQGAAHRQSFNFLIQGLCADMIRAGMINAWFRAKSYPEWGLKTIMQVHDEAVYIVKEEYVKEATFLVEKAFEDATKNFIIPLKADIEIGTNYGDSKK